MSLQWTKLPRMFEAGDKLTADYLWVASGRVRAYSVSQVRTTGRWKVRVSFNDGSVIQLGDYYPIGDDDATEEQAKARAQQWEVDFNEDDDGE